LGWLKQKVCLRQLRNLLLDERTELRDGHDVHPLKWHDSCGKFNHMLQQRLAANECLELLGILLAGDRPQASTGTTSHNQDVSVGGYIYHVNLV